MTRRLIGWRVRWEQWGNGWAGWMPHVETWRDDERARMFAGIALAVLRFDGDVRNVRLMRVYRRSKR